jgi:DNA mismatch repair ATPase MutS
MIQSELDDDYFSKMEAHLKNLEFRSGTMISANLGRGNEGFGYILRLPKIEKGVWLRRLFRKAKDEYSFSISPRDESGSRMLSDLRDRGINLAANAIAQSAEHIDSFIDMLQHELGFYIGCLNLSDHLDHLECPKIFPSMENKEVRTHSFHGLYDVCLALTMKQNIVGNTIEAVAKDLFIISGANQGGKSTFLRSIGVAQMMMQSGMFVGANQFKANICQAVFTHFKRKEDATMESGKLDEELTRMSEIVDAIIPNSLMLFNESFTTTNEREGSEIAYQITKALQVKKIKVFFVTHMYEFAHSYYAKNLKSAIFLQAERKSSGKRTFRLKVSEPTQTSFGVDVYNEVFGFSTEKNS